MSRARDYELFAVEGLPLQSGEDCPTLSVAYKTYGTLNARRDNAILYPTSFSAQHHDTEWLVRPGGTLDPERYFIVIPNLFGNGLSSSPSNFAAAPFPTLTYHDAVAAQHRMLTELWGIEELALVYGWSMGGMQAYHWAALHPDMVRRVAVVCGSARCSPYNAVFLEAVRAALTADPAFVDGRFRHAPGAGFRAMGRVYAGWALSHAFFSDELWRGYGYTSLEDYLSRNWDGLFAKLDANDLLAQLGIWQRGDLSHGTRFGGDLGSALGSITADVLLMPGETDRYFDPRDNADELGLLANARSKVLRPIPSAHGHRAGNPVNIPEDHAFITAAITSLLHT